MLATRLLGAAAFVFLAPGVAWVARMPDAFEWPEHLVYGFAISYTWIFALSIVLPIFGWTVDAAALLTVAFVALAIPWRRSATLAANIGRSLRPSTTGVVLTLVVLAFAAAAWWIEPVMHGDAALDLISVSRFADGGPIHFDNTSILPASRATYIFQPYQLALGMVARWSGVDALVAFEKVRPVLVLLSLTSVFVLLTQLATVRAHALWAFTVILTFVGLDTVTWQDKSLYPVVHRGGIAAGICAPVLMTLMLTATRRRAPEYANRRRIAMWLAPAFLLAFMCTHALEVYTQLFFAAAIGVTIMLGADPERERPRAWMLAASLGIALALYLPVHARAVPELTAFESDLKHSMREEFAAGHRTLGEKLAGAMAQESEDLLAHRLPATTAAVIGVPALAAVMFTAPSAAMTIGIAIIVLAAIFASPIGFLGLAVATSADSAQETTAYFALLGLLGFSLGVAAVVSGTLASTARVRSRLVRGALFCAVAAILVLVWPRIAQRIGTSMLTFVRSEPRTAVGFAAAIVGMVVVYAVGSHGRVTRIASTPSLVGAALAALIAQPLVGLGLPDVQRVPLSTALTQSRAVPSVLDGPAYYDLVEQTILPPLPVEPSIVADLRARLPPRQVVIADPHYSCSLAALLDAYCVNPEHVYGQYYLGALKYQLQYVHSIDGGHGDWHPFFNDTWPMENRERRFLDDYRPSYLLADPAHAELIARKLDALRVRVETAYSRDGYVLYHLESRQ